MSSLQSLELNESIKFIILGKKSCLLYRQFFIIVLNMECPLSEVPLSCSFPSQDMLAQSHVEQENLIQVVSELEGQLGEVRVQLDQEKHNCQ